MKKYTAPLLILAIFETIAVSLWLVKENLFYLFNFSYIGGSLALGLPLFAQRKPYARHIVQFLVGSYMLVYLGILVAAAVWWYLTCTKTGLRLRSVGENPGAADSVGVNILLYKYVHLILGSGIMGLGGFYMALNMGGSFEGSNCWINGYGWIAIALVIFANWNPLYAILGTLVFGFFNTLQISSGSLAGAFPDALGWLNSIPSHLFKALPFLITAIVLVVTSIRKREGSGQPAALGLNYFREER